MTTHRFSDDRMYLKGACAKRTRPRVQSDNTVFSTSLLPASVTELYAQAKRYSAELLPGEPGANYPAGAEAKVVVVTATSEKQARERAREKLGDLIRGDWCLLNLRAVKYGLAQPRVGQVTCLDRAGN